MVSPTLTTVKQDGALRAEIAISKLLELRQNKEVTTNILLPVTLVERESTNR
ncbi:substrate-binding domain-containing protein [Bacteroides heparinolyticus]